MPVGKELGWEVKKAGRAFRLWCSVTPSEEEKGRRWKLLVSPFSLRKVCESFQGILTKVIYQTGTVSLRITSAIGSSHHLATGRELLWEGGFGINPTIDSRVQQLGPLVSNTPCGHRSARCMFIAFTICHARPSSSTRSWACTPGASPTWQACCFPSSSQYLSACPMWLESTGSQAMSYHKQHLHVWIPC